MYILGCFPLHSSDNANFTLVYKPAKILKEPLTKFIHGKACKKHLTYTYFCLLNKKAGIMLASNIHGSMIEICLATEKILDYMCIIMLIFDGFTLRKVKKTS